MKIKLEQNIDTSIPVFDMHDGDIAVIVKWPSNAIGSIVQRVGNELIQIGGVDTDIHFEMFNKRREMYRVCLLKCGDKIVIC